MRRVSRSSPKPRRRPSGAKRTPPPRPQKFLLVVAETERRLGAGGQAETRIEDACDCHGALCLQPAAFGSIPGEMLVGKGHGRCAGNGRAPCQAGPIVPAAQRGKRRRDPAATLDLEGEGFDAGFGLKLSGQHVGDGNGGAHGVREKALRRSATRTGSQGRRGGAGSPMLQRRATPRRCSPDERVPRGEGMQGQDFRVVFAGRGSRVRPEARPGPVVEIGPGERGDQTRLPSSGSQSPPRCSADSLDSTV